MAYATAADLFDAMHVTASNKRAELSPLAESCLDAAAIEIDQACGRLDTDPLPTNPPNALAHMVNIARAVEWFKANDAAFGALGFANLGVMSIPAEGFARHAAALIPLTQTFGLG